METRMTTRSRRSGVYLLDHDDVLAADWASIVLVVDESCAPETARHMAAQDEDALDWLRVADAASSALGRRLFATPFRRRGSLSGGAGFRRAPLLFDVLGEAFHSWPRIF